MIATTPQALKILLEKEERHTLANKVRPVKTSFFRIPNPMEAIEEIGRYPVIKEKDYLEEKSAQEEEDFYLLRKEFAKFAREVLPSLNQITSLILGEAYAKKVRYGVTYSAEIEGQISYVVEKLEKELVPP